VALFAAAPVPAAAPRRPRRARAETAEPAVEPAAPEAPSHVEPPSLGESHGGHVLFSLRGTTYAVSVADVREISRAELHPVALGTTSADVALVDVRGRSIPVVDLRAEKAGHGDVLLPLWRSHAGVVVDRVLSVTPEGALVPEPGDVPQGLPAWVRAVLRPVAGGSPVLLVSLPEAASLGTDAARLGDLVLGPAS
jgi:hypothetical protein